MTKPTALLLADDLEQSHPHSAAYELRRQHKLIGELVEALDLALHWVDGSADYLAAAAKRDGLAVLLKAKEQQ